MNIWVALAILVASFILEAVAAPKPKGQTPSLLSDFQFPQFEEDIPQQVVFGDVWISGWEVLWYGNLRSEAISSSNKK